MFEGPVQRLVDELSRLPGIGAKSAQRLAFHLLTVEEADASVWPPPSPTCAGGHL